MTRAAGKKKLNLTSSVKETGAFRGIKLVRPECHVPVSQSFRDQTFNEYTTGPCQIAVKDQKELAYSWFKTCTHGPEFDTDGTPIPPELRPYYETVMVPERKPSRVEGGKVREWEDSVRYEAKLRIRDVAWNPRLMGGFAIRRAQQMGAKPIEEFDIAPFCEMHGCFRQDVHKYKNGLFCTEAHAKLVKATETDEFMYLAWDQGSPRAISTKARQDQLAKIEV